MDRESKQIFTARQGKLSLSRRNFLAITFGAGLGLALPYILHHDEEAEAIPGLLPLVVAGVKYVTGQVIRFGVPAVVMAILHNRTRDFIPPGKIITDIVDRNNRREDRRIVSVQATYPGESIEVECGAYPRSTGSKILYVVSRVNNCGGCPFEVIPG